MSALDVIVTTLKHFKIDKAVEKVNFSFPVLFSCRILAATQFQSSFEDARKHNTFRRPPFPPSCCHIM